MKYLLGAVAVSLLTACSQNVETEQEANTQSMSYPDTRKGDVVDTYFGTEVADPYRWLEDDRSEETENWVKAHPISRNDRKASDRIVELRENQRTV